MFWDWSFYKLTFIKSASVKFDLIFGSPYLENIRMDGQLFTISLVQYFVIPGNTSSVVGVNSPVKVDIYQPIRHYVSDICM